MAKATNETTTSRRADAHFEMEGPICDLRHMSDIAFQLAAETLGGPVSDIQRDNADTVLFAVTHLNEMMREFHKAYYETFPPSKAE